MSLSRSNSTVILYKCYLGIAIRRFEERNIDSITPQDLKEYFRFLQTDYEPWRIKGSTRVGQPLSASSLDNHWKILRSFFRWCHEQGYTRKFVAETLPRPKFELAQIVPFSQSEIIRIIKAAEYYPINKDGKIKYGKRPNAVRNLAIVFILLDTGMRVGECSRLLVAGSFTVH